MILIDADIVVDVLRGHPPAVSWLVRGELQDITISGYTYMELVQGCRNGHALAQVKRVTGKMNLVWLGADDCERAVGIFERYKLSHSIGLIDSLVASTALCFGTPIHTFNEKHFGCVEGLRIVKPYAR